MSALLQTIWEALRIYFTIMAWCFSLEYQVKMTMMRLLPAHYRAATRQTVQVFFVSLLYFILSLIEKPGGGKSTLIHRAHSRLSYLHRWERDLYLYVSIMEKRFQAQLGLSKKIRCNQSSLNLFRGPGLAQLRVTPSLHASLHLS